MKASIRWGAVALACALAAGCKREAPAPATTPAPAPAPTPLPAPARSAPAAPVSTPAAPATPRAAPQSASNAAAAPLEAVAITSATLGRAVSADKRVTAATDTFRPGDTIFLAVETSGAGGANLTARWTYVAGGEATRVNEETQKLPAGGPAVTEFHIRKPDGWPRGAYQVVVLLNGEPSVTKKFKVE